MLLDPGQVNALHKVTDGQHAGGIDGAVVHGSHMACRFGFDIGWRPLATRRHWTERIGHTLLFDDSAEVAALPIAHVPVA